MPFGNVELINEESYTFLVNAAYCITNCVRKETVVVVVFLFCFVLPSHIFQCSL